MLMEFTDAWLDGATVAINIKKIDAIRAMSCQGKRKGEGRIVDRNQACIFLEGRPQGFAVSGSCEEVLAKVREAEKREAKRGRGK